MKFFLLLIIIVLVGIQESCQLPKHKHEIQNALRFDLNNYQSENQQNLPASDTIENNYFTLPNLWESVRYFVAKIKDQLKTWSLIIKQKVLVLAENFEKRLDIMKNEFRKMIKDVLVTGDAIKECLQGDKEAIEIILKDILNDVTSCLSSHMSHIHKLDDSQLSPYFDDELILEEVKNKFNSRLETCSQTENHEECANGIKNEIIADIENIKWNASQKAFVARSLMDDTMDAIVKCFTEGLLKASSIISDETIKIVQCVKNHNEIQNSKDKGSLNTQILVPSNTYF